MARQPRVTSTRQCKVDEHRKVVCRGETLWNSPRSVEKLNPSLLHSLVGAELAIEKFGVTEFEVLEAVRNHTTGRPSMGIISRVLYVADFAEPMRTYDEAHVVRKFAYTELERAVHHVARAGIERLLQKGVMIHPNTLHAYNEMFVNTES